MKLEWLAGDTGCPGPSCQEEIAKPGLAAERCRLRQPSSPSKGSGGSLKLAELGAPRPWAVDASCLCRASPCAEHPSAPASSPLCPGIIPPPWHPSAPASSLCCSPSGEQVLRCTALGQGQA